MEIEGVEKTVIAKPVAWRPGFSDFKSFPELLSGQVDAAPPTAISETAIAAIRPKTVRFKPSDSTNSAEVEVSGSAACFPTNEVLEPTVVYKPVAKLVSKMTASFLANLGQGSGGFCTEQDITTVRGHLQPSTEVKNHIDSTTDTDQCPISHARVNAKCRSENLPDNRDRPAYDGHNWRKYGQKQVKGSEYARSYYKCTYPNCPVKKKVEITVDGQIAERIYKGEHNHSKPHTVMSTRLDEHVQRSASDAVQNLSCGETERPLFCNIETSANPTFSCAVPPANDALTATNHNAGVPMSNNSFCASEDHVEVKDTVEAEGGDFISKRRKGEKNLSFKAGEENATPESRAFVQNTTDSETTTGDGFRWRKYGQKIVKGNSYPRSYYRCTSSKCSAKKYVEKTSETGTGTYITTYEGGHNHEMPIKGTPSEALRVNTKNKSATTHSTLQTLDKQDHLDA